MNDTLLLIKQYNLMVRPSLVNGNWRVGVFKGVSAVGGKAYCHNETVVEMKSIEEAVAECIKRLGGKLNENP